MKWTIQLFVIWWVVHWASCGVSYITGKLWYTAVQQYTLYIYNIHIRVKAAYPVISSALSGPSGCLWYDGWPTKFHKENVVSLKTCDIQLSNSMYYILVTSVYEPKQLFRWPLEHQMDHPAVCDMISGPLSFLWSISYITGKLWYTAVQQYTLYIYNIHIRVKVACPMFSSAWNELSGCLWYDEWPTKLHNENVRSLKTCDMQLSSSIYYILVTLVYESKRPCQWSLVHQMDHLAVCGMMGGPLSFLWRILHHWKAVICSYPIAYIIYL